MRRLLALLLPLVLLAACGDDDAAGPTTTVADDIESSTDETETASETGDDGTDPDDADAAPETTSAEDAPAGDGPGDGAGEGDGLGDAVLAGDLDGSGPIPGPGHPSATGRFEAELVEGTLCVDMVVTGLDSSVTEAHLHSGRPGEAGPVLVDIGPPSSTSETTSTWTDVCTGVDDAVIEDLADAPELAYTDIHSGSYPDGALRGQLRVISIFDRELD